MDVSAYVTKKQTTVGGEAGLGQCRDAPSYSRDLIAVYSVCPYLSVGVIASDLIALLMLHPNDHLAADPNVLFTQLGDEEGVLLHLDTQYYYSLNETGLLIWRGITKGMSLGEVARALEAEYEIDADGAWQQVSDFASLLREKKLLADPAAAKGKT